jgi:prophage maintenance system killer protein
LIVDTIHSELILEHGGAPGIAAGGDDLLESALARPRGRFVDEPDSDLATLAAATFLWLNGLRLTASESDAYDAVIGTVEGSRTESEIADWLRKNTEPAH